MKLSKTQQQIIAKMRPDVWYSAYDLQTSIATMDALARKGLAKRRHSAGSMFSPRTNIEFKLCQGIKIAG